MKTVYKSRIEYEDVDSSMQLRLSELQSYLLKSSDDGVEKSGLSTKYLRQRYNSAWVLVSMSVEIEQMPSYYEHIEVVTWDTVPSHNIVKRDYLIYCFNGICKSLVGRAVSTWTILNLQNRTISHESFMDQLWFKGQNPDGLKIPRARFDMDLEYDRFKSFFVSYSDLDFNGHLNSCKYIQFFLDTDNSLATSRLSGLTSCTVRR